VALLLPLAERRAVAPELESRLAGTNPALLSLAGEADGLGGLALRAHRGRGSANQGLALGLVVNTVTNEAADLLEDAETPGNSFILADTTVLVEIQGRVLSVDFIISRLGASRVAAAGRANGSDWFGVILSGEFLALGNALSGPLSEFVAINEAIVVGIEFREGLEGALSDGLFCHLVSGWREI
jgi:hypothetical protein